MTLHLTPDMLAAAYDLLRTTPPFRGWKLPESDDVGFHIIAAKTVHAQHWVENFTHHISVHKEITHLESMLKLLAHEMCHMRQVILGKRKAEHGAAFQRLADQVCRKHGFDRGTF